MLRLKKNRKYLKGWGGGGCQIVSPILFEFSTSLCNKQLVILMQWKQKMYRPTQSKIINIASLRAFFIKKNK